VNQILASFLMLFCVGCSKYEPDPIVQKATFQLDLNGKPILIGVFVIDSCEYVGQLAEYSPNPCNFLTHKGNCRFCQQRQQISPFENSTIKSHKINF